MFMSELGGNRISKEAYQLSRFFLEFLTIWKEIEIGESFEIDHASVFGYINHLNSINEFWECETREDYFEVFTNMAANNKLHLMQFIILTEWQKKILTNEFNLNK